MKKTIAHHQKFQRAASVSALAIILTAFTGPVMAQESEQQADDGLSLDEIIVTGSRISRKDFVAPSPIVTTDMEAISVSGRTTVEDFLRDMPQFAPGSGDYSNDSNGGTAGRATLNLRNLGSKRNLVIMDGRRLMSSGTDGAIDINTIPSLAIGSIETITGGASATYGSDALSGVVNFKTRTDLDGLDVSGQYTTLDEAGESTWQVGAAYGTDYADGRGRLLVSAEYLNRGGIAQNERDFFLDPQPSSFITQGRTTPGFRADSATGAAILGLADGESPSGFYSVNDDGTVFDQSTGVGYNGPTDLPSIGTRAHPSYDNYIQVPLDQLSLFAKTEYDVSDYVTAYTQGIYSSTEALNVGSAPVVAGPWTVLVPTDNYFIQNDPALEDWRTIVNSAPAGIIDYQARISQAGPRTYETNNDVYQILAGFKGQVEDMDLNWDIHASFGKTKTTDSTISGSVSVSALQELVDAPDGGDSICSGGYNPFGGTDPLSEACLDYVSRTPENETVLKQTVLEGILEGKLIDMPAGEARFALTGHYRKNTYDFTPDDDIAADDLASLSAQQATNGSIEATELAAEVLLPLVSDAAFLDSLNLTLGYRYSHYDPAGSGHTYKVELDAQVNNYILLRGGFQRALRAPNVEEFFLAGRQRVTAVGSDPCSSTSSPTGDVLTLCEQMGVFVRDDGSVAYRQASQSNPTLTSGNPDLEPEDAETLTFGAVFNLPIQSSDLTISVDYFDIQIENAIEAISARDSLSKCYNVDGSNPTYDINNFFCQQISRSGVGGLDPILQPILNLGGFKTSGIDIAANWSVPIGDSDTTLLLSSFVTILDKYEIQTFEGEDFVDYAGTVSNEFSFPEVKMFNSITINSGPVSVVGSWRYLSAMDDRSAALDPATTIEGTPSYSYFDATVRWAITDDYEIYGGVNNISNKEQPIVGGANAVTNPGTFDVVGRTFFFGARARF